jgi:hypothetical protein
LARHVDVVLPGNLLLIDLESRTDGECTKNESAYNVCQMSVLVLGTGKRSRVTVDYVVALSGRPEPRGQHKGIYQQELIRLRFRDRGRSQSGCRNGTCLPDRRMSP